MPDPLVPPPIPEARRRGDSAPILALSALVVAMSLVGLGAHRRRGRALPPPPKAPVFVESPGALALREGRRLDLNQASAEDLELLPRVGPAIAGRILAARPFARVEDLTRVRGIGERTLERLRPLVRVGAEDPEPDPSLAPRGGGDYQGTSTGALEPHAGASL